MDRPTWMTDEIVAHRDFSVVLASFSIAWGKLEAEHREALKPVQEQLDEVFGRQVSLRAPQHDKDETMARLRGEFKERLDPHEIPAGILRDRRAAAKSGLLAVTQTDVDNPASAICLPPELVTMAKLAGRLEIIEHTPAQ